MTWKLFSCGDIERNIIVRLGDEVTVDGKAARVKSIELEDIERGVRAMLHLEDGRIIDSADVTLVQSIPSRGPYGGIFGGI